MLVCEGHGGAIGTGRDGERSNGGAGCAGDGFKNPAGGQRRFLPDFVVAKRQTVDGPRGCSGIRSLDVLDVSGGEELPCEAELTEGCDVLDGDSLRVFKDFRDADAAGGSGRGGDGGDFYVIALGRGGTGGVESEFFIRVSHGAAAQLDLDSASRGLRLIGREGGNCPGDGLAIDRTVVGGGGGDEGELVVRGESHGERNVVCNRGRGILDGGGQRDFCCQSRADGERACYGSKGELERGGCRSNIDCGRLTLHVIRSSRRDRNDRAGIDGGRRRFEDHVRGEIFMSAGVECGNDPVHHRILSAQGTVIGRSALDEEESAGERDADGDAGGGSDGGGIGDPRCEHDLGTEIDGCGCATESEGVGGDLFVGERDDGAISANGDDRRCICCAIHRSSAGSDGLEHPACRRRVLFDGVRSWSIEVIDLPFTVTAGTGNSRRIGAANDVGSKAERIERGDQWVLDNLTGRVFEDCDDTDAADLWRGRGDGNRRGTRRLRGDCCHRRSHLERGVGGREAGTCETEQHGEIF